MRRKHFLGLLITSCVLAFVYIGFLFLPYFADTNGITHSVIKIVYGYQVGFGVSGQPDVKIVGNTFIAIGQIGGILAAIFSVIFIIGFGLHKKENPIFFFLFGIAVAGLALAFTSSVLAWPMYQNLNASSKDVAIFSWTYIVSTVAIALAFVIEGFLLIYLGFNRKKRWLEN